MSVPARKLLDIESFFDFVAREDGKWELYDGQAVAMAPQRALQGYTKTEAAFALREALKRAGLPCRVYVDSLTVRVRQNRAFVPDVLVVCPPAPPEAIEIDNAIIVVEVLSPTTAALDHGIKLEGYFSLPSLAHYLILDADRRVVIHHKRGQGDFIETRIVSAGMLTLSPPGLEVQVDDLFGPAEVAEA